MVLLVAVIGLQTVCEARPGRDRRQAFTYRCGNPPSCTCLDDLRYVDCTSAELSKIPAFGTFHYLSVEQLFLSGNNFTHVPAEELAKWKVLHFVELSSNPVCSGGDTVTANDGAVEVVLDTCPPTSPGVAQTTEGGDDWVGPPFVPVIPFEGEGNSTTKTETTVTTVTTTKTTTMTTTDTTTEPGTSASTSTDDTQTATEGIEPEGHDDGSRGDIALVASLSVGVPLGLVTLTCAIKAVYTRCKKVLKKRRQTAALKRINEISLDDLPVNYFEGGMYEADLAQVAGDESVGEMKSRAFKKACQHVGGLYDEESERILYNARRAEVKMEKLPRKRTPSFEKEP